MRNRAFYCLLVCFGLIAVPVLASKLGIFSAHQDIGSVKRKGKVKYDRRLDSYTITGGGANIWGATDAFQYVYQQTSGDVSLTTDVAWVGKSAEGHRKAGIMIRQNLDDNSPYVDVMVHGDGLASMQYRETTGATTKEMRSDVKSPKMIRLVREGDRFSMAAGDSLDDLKTTGPLTVHLTDPVFIGFAVCAHNANNMETAIFSTPKIVTGKVVQ